MVVLWVDLLLSLLFLKWKHVKQLHLQGKLGKWIVFRLPFPLVQGQFLQNSQKVY